ncbi:hypothetical protein BC832DRAFT_560837, partial [Gaertneriomyces semiglobifer]
VYIVGNTGNDDMSSERYARSIFSPAAGSHGRFALISSCRGCCSRCSHGDAHMAMLHTAMLTWR